MTDFELLFERFELLVSLAVFEKYPESDIEKLQSAPDVHARIARMPIGRFIWDSGRRMTLFEQLKKSDFREDIFAAGFGQIRKTADSSNYLRRTSNSREVPQGFGHEPWQYPAPRGLLSFAQAPARPPSSVRLGPRTFTLTLPKGVPHCNVRFMPTTGLKNSLGTNTSSGRCQKEQPRSRVTRISNVATKISLQRQVRYDTSNGISII
jgi:hypothetical protein